MSYTIQIKNDSGSTQSWAGKEFVDQEEYTVPTDANRTKWQNSSTLLTAIASADALVGNGVEYFTDVSEAINWLKGALSSMVEMNPFAAKTIADKSIFKRAVGKRYSLSSGTNTLVYVVDFVSCKMTGLELIGGEAGDYVDLRILDTAAGTVSTIPNYPLNQFGFEVNIAAGHHREDSNYDADLFVGLQVEVTYESISAKDVGINYILHEVK